MCFVMTGTRRPRRRNVCFLCREADTVRHIDTDCDIHCWARSGVRVVTRDIIALLETQDPGPGIHTYCSGHLLLSWHTCLGDISTSMSVVRDDSNPKSFSSSPSSSTSTPQCRMPNSTSITKQNVTNTAGYRKIL